MTSSLIKTIVSQEIKVLTRNKVIVCIFIITVAMVLSSIWIGSNMLRKQEKTIAEIGQSQGNMRDTLKARITRVQQNNMVYNGYIWNDPTFVYNASRNDGSAFAIKPAFQLQVLSLGQSDVQPFYYKVNTGKKQTLVFEEEIYNSFLQFLGNFDFSFVVVFLLPLVIIIFSYNILSSEKEQGTWVLLKTSNLSISRLLLLKTVLRYSILSLLFWLATVLTMITQIGTSFLGTSNWWYLFAGISIYIGFWFALSLFVNSFSMNSGMNAITLILIWLFTTVLFPGILQIGLDKKHPIPNRVQLLNIEREAVNKFFAKGEMEITRDVFENPLAQIRQAQQVTPQMIYGYGLVAGKTTGIRDAAIDTAQEKLYEQIEKQQTTIRKFQLLSPALMMQETMSALAGTHWHQFNQFSKDVDTFRTTLQQYYNPKMASEKTYRTFSVPDAEAIPVFRPKDYRNFDWLHLPLTVAVYAVFTFLLMAVGYGKMKRVQR